MTPSTPEIDRARRDEEHRFVADIAGLLLDGEDDGEGNEFCWENDDAWATLHQLIESARDIQLRR
jgi:hypothetical protein